MQPQQYIVFLFLQLFLPVTFAYQPPNVWTTFGELAARTKGVNLGQGYPDWQPPQFVLDSLQSSSFHQYTRPAGHPKLVELLAERYGRHLNRPIHPMNEIAVTVGASQALYLTLLTLLKAGDEVVMFDPFFELYTKQIALTGASPKFVHLNLIKGHDGKESWQFDLKALEAVIGPQTKVLLLNSPHNPTGKVFTLAELEGIADIVRRHPHVTVVSDEVYKYTVYNPLEAGDPTSQGHYHFARLPGMWDRTVTISSCGKTFSVTGWQVGWALAPERYIAPIHQLLPCVQFCAASPIQEALCQALVVAEQPYEGFDSYYEYLRAQFANKRAVVEEALAGVGIEAIPSNGGFFLMGKLPEVSRESLAKYIPQEVVGKEPYDWSYLRMLGEKYRVIGIPASPFFSEGYLNTENRKYPYMARFAFCKKDSTLEEARRLLCR